ncbi:alpha/beta hydrolase [Reticulibacter mediterranei]|uniref:Alpha/beta hydrolase n=1 Tax=Reticulibacter mediterranei TaxID=2778369 RepID=A0A8J3ICW3_9CHLR|nr:alpha/beta hydrolase [Reticulibacter mediterranei]GHO90110.1 alpha/beta hydrolase [Reticulibacter mediterranei]
MDSFLPFNQVMPRPTHEGLLHLPGVSLFVRRFGTAGPPVILIHGGPDWDQSYFFPFLAPLAHSCRLIAFDLRGCGRSHKFGDPQHYHIDLVVEDLAQLLASLHLERATLLGFSYGGRVALRFLDRYPSKVSKLILASSTAYDHFADELEQWDEYQSRYPQALREQVSALWGASSPSPEQRTRQLAELTLPLNIYHLELLPLVRQVIDQIDFSGEWMQAWQAGRLRGVQHSDYAQRFAALGTPLLILHGEKDMGFPVAVAKRLAEQVPGALLTILPQTGHVAHIEATEAWNTAILQFLFKDE